jgi:CDP-diglyceride synthetase
MFINSLFGVLIFILVFAIFIWMILDVLKRKFKFKYAKQVWIAALCLLPIIAMAIYHNTKEKKDN